MRQNFWSALRRLHVLEGRNPAISESHYLAGIRDTLREPGITKRIVQRRSEIDVPRGVIWVVWVTSVIGVNPGFCRTTAHVAYNLSIGRPPRQPHGGAWHPDANLSLIYERLVSGWKSLVKVWMLRNSRLRGWTGSDNQGARSDSEPRCTKEKPTLHAASKSYSPPVWQAKLGSWRR